MRAASNSVQATQQFTGQYPPLEQVTRPSLKTEEAAFYLNRRPQTLRLWAMREDGPVRPIRVCGRLAWKTTEIRALLGIAAA